MTHLLNKTSEKTNLVSDIEFLGFFWRCKYINFTFLHHLYRRKQNYERKIVRFEMVKERKDNVSSNIYIPMKEKSKTTFFYHQSSKAGAKAFFVFFIVTRIIL
jgi:hypothetical protein